MEPHDFVHGETSIYCRRCGYVCFVSDSTFERNNARQKNVPVYCRMSFQVRTPLPGRDTFGLVRTGGR